MIKAFFTNSVGILFSRIFGLIRDLLTASVLGAGVYSDIFFIAFKLPNLFRRLFAEGAFSQAFMPGFVKSNKKGLFLAEIFVKFLVFILFLSIIVMLFAGFFTKLIAFGFDEHTTQLSIPFVCINFWYLFFIFLVTLFASVLQYRGHFATTAFSTILLNLSMIVAMLLAKDKDKEEILYYLSFGVVIGGILQFLVHLIALKYTGMMKLFLLGLKEFKNKKRADTSGFYKNFFHGVIGSSATQIAGFLDTWFASFLAFGSISYLYYANRIFQLPLALFAIALSTALFPKISKQIKANNDKLALNLLSKSFHLLLFLLLASSIGGIILSKEIIVLLFQRGEFDANNTKECAKVLQMFLIGLLPFGLSKLFSLWLYSKMKQKLAAKITIKSLILNSLLCLIFLKPLQASGLALASSISGFYLLYANLKEFGFKNFLGIIDYKKIALICACLIIETLILLFFKEFINAYL